MSKKLELLKEKEALECRLREVDRLLSSIGVVGPANLGQNGHTVGGDREAARAWLEEMKRLNEEEPYVPEEWEELERNLGIYEEVHGHPPA